MAFGILSSVVPVRRVKHPRRGWQPTRCRRRDLQPQVRGTPSLLDTRAGLHSAERQTDYRPERVLVNLAESLVNPVTGRRNTLGR